MKRLLQPKIVAFTFFATILLSLSIKADSFDAKQIKKSIIGYNMQLIEAAKSEEFLKSYEDKRKLERFAEEKVAQKLYIWIKSWHENSLYMDARLLDITFGKVSQKGDTADVVTDEIWIYRYYRVEDDGKKREAYTPAKKIYKVRYVLRKSGKQWKIVSVEVFFEKEQKL